TTTKESKRKQNGCLLQNSERHPCAPNSIFYVSRILGTYQGLKPSPEKNKPVDAAQLTKKLRPIFFFYEKIGRFSMKKTS
ncbi:hypothetical protein, partial [Hominenteromicrobium sp.]|uniref:hypothetical protein n=1 Tax=Hominenteromicrobium sp. TaxID=3073581 RepID=UPI003AB4CC47